MPQACMLTTRHLLRSQQPAKGARPWCSFRHSTVPATATPSAPAISDRSKRFSQVCALVSFGHPFAVTQPPPHSPAQTDLPSARPLDAGGTSNPSKVVASSQFWVIVRGTGVWPKSLGPGTLDIVLGIASAAHPSVVSGACLLVAARAHHHAAASAGNRARTAHASAAEREKPMWAVRHAPAGPQHIDARARRPRGRTVAGARKRCGDGEPGARRHRPHIHSHERIIFFATNGIVTQFIIERLACILTKCCRGIDPMNGHIRPGASVLGWYGAAGYVMNR